MDSLMNNAPCGFISFGDDGVILAANATLLAMLGFEPDELRGRRFEALLSVGGRIFYQTHFFPLLKLHGRAEEIYLTLRPKGGGELPVLANAVRQERDGVLVNDCVLVTMRQRSRYEDDLLRAKKTAEEAIRAKEEAYAALLTKQAELLELNTRLEQLSTADPLTGLKNRRAFETSLTLETALAPHYRQPLSLLLLDVDHFKRINDSFGHTVGDAVLIQIAQFLRQNARESDLVARYGGEEFAMLLPSTDQAGALEAGERLRLCVEEGTRHEIAATISVGVATFVPGTPINRSLLVLADHALYASKRRGRNRVTHAAELDLDGESSLAAGS